MLINPHFGAVIPASSTANVLEAVRVATRAAKGVLDEGRPWGFDEASWGALVGNLSRAQDRAATLAATARRAEEEPGYYLKWLDTARTVADEVEDIGRMADASQLSTLADRIREWVRFAAETAGRAAAGAGAITAEALLGLLKGLFSNPWVGAGAVVVGLVVLAPPVIGAVARYRATVRKQLTSGS